MYFSSDSERFREISRVFERFREISRDFNNCSDFLRLYEAVFIRPHPRAFGIRYGFHKVRYSEDQVGYRNRIRGICEDIVEGKADDDEPEALTIERVERTTPEKLKPLPHAQGLSVSLNYEKGSQERKYKATARGGATAPR